MADSALAQRKPADWNLGGILAVAFGHGVNDFFSGTVALTIFFVVSSAHLSPWYQGAVGFLWYLTSSIVQPLFGAYSDRHGRWWFMPTGVLLVVCAISCAALAPSLGVLALLIVVGGIGSAVMHPEAGKYAALLSGTRKSSAISIFQIGGTIGYALGPVAIAALLAQYGKMGSLVLLAPGLAACACVYAVVRRADAVALRAQAAERKAGPPSTKPVDHVGIALVVGSTTMRFLTTVGFVTYLPNLLTARGGTLIEAGQLVTAFLLLGNVGMYLGGYLGDKFGSIVISIVSLVLAVPALIAFFYTPLPYAIGFLLFGNVLLTVQNAPAVVIVQSMLPKNLGMALGLINGVAFGVGSALVACVGIAVTQWGPQTALMQVAVMPLLAAAALSVVSRRTRVPAPR